MTIALGDKLPAAKFTCMQDGAVVTLTTDEVFANKRVVLFAVPGAFTPTCSKGHLPGFVQHAEEFFARGIDTIACLSVNDAFVMDAWGQQHGADKILMLSDGNATFVQAIGLALDLQQAGLGIRSNRYAMLVVDCVLSQLHVEPGSGLEVSGAEAMLASLDAT